MSYLAVYRALVFPTQEPTVVAQGDDYLVSLHPGPATIHFQSMSPHPLSPGNTMEIGYDSRTFPPGSYVFVEVIPRVEATAIGARWNAAFDRIAQLVAALDLQFPGIVREKLYEGTVATPSASVHIDSEEGIRLGGRSSYQPSDVAAVLQARADHVRGLSEADAARFTLASRWFRRANDSKSLIDRVLFYYMVLEVFPSVEGHDVPGDVARFLAKHVYPGITAQDVKARLDLGRICHFRGEIVHDGKASIATMEEWRKVDGYVQRLEAVARTCLRLLAGLSPGSELDRFVRHHDG